MRIAWLAALAASPAVAGCGASSGPAAPGAGESARVVRVVDGDTIRVRTATGGAVVRVRYIGVDTPEIAHPGTKDARPAGCFGREADRANRALLPEGEAVRLVFDADRRDRYGRVLAYVYRRRDGLFVNERLVRDGLARTLVVAPNVRFAGRFATLAREAERARRGLWGRC